MPPKMRPKRPPDAPKSSQVRSKMAIDAIFFEKRDFSRNLIKTNEKSLFLTPRGDPKRPKNSPRRSQDGLEELLFRCLILSSILVRFGSHFGAILAPFWQPLGSQNRTKFGFKFEDRPKRPQETPKRPQEAPRRPQEAPKRHPKGTHGQPRAQKREPRAPKRHARAPKRQEML